MENSNELLVEIKKLNKHLSRLNRRQAPFRLFLTGLLSGLASVIGASLVFSIVIYLFSQVDLVPIIGDWLADVFSHMLKELPPTEQ